MFAPEPGCATKRPPPFDREKSDLVAVVTAIPEEFQAIAKVVRDVESAGEAFGDDAYVLRGTIAGAPALLSMTGDGAPCAAASVSFLLRETPVSLLVGAGAAGGLVPSLRAGEVVVSGRVLDESGEAPAPDATLLTRAASLGAKAATVVTVARPLTSSSERDALAVRIGASASAPAVVDMESAAWARAAARLGVPYVVFRAVSDAFEDDLPRFLPSCLSPEGSIDRAAVALRLVARPDALPALLRARGRVRDGAAAIALFLERFLPAKI